MTATEDLRSEHIGVARMLRIMEHMGEHVSSGEPVDAGILDEVLEFLRVFVDQCHHYKEEQLLFPALREAGIASLEPTVDILLADHVRGRELVASIAAATAGVRHGADGADADLVTAITSYAELLHAHIRREEDDCFAVADRELPPAIQEDLQVGYDRIEREVVGEGRHEAFHEMLDRLGALYRV